MEPSNAVDEDWELLRSFFAADWKTLALQSGALKGIERALLDQGIHTSWETVRQQLSTPQMVTVRLPLTDGRLLTIRRDTRPEPVHCDIYRVLRVPERIVVPSQRWSQNSH